MVKITVVDSAGAERRLDAHTGGTLMEALRDNDCAEIEAICGGCCSCATCHVYVNSACYQKLSKPENNEKMLLSSLENVRQTSRLSCQIIVDQSCDGLIVELARPDSW